MTEDWISIETRPIEESELTLSKLIEFKEALEEREREAAKERFEKGFFAWGEFRHPRSKRRRIRKKWRKNGRAYGVRWFPPGSPEANDYVRVEGRLDLP